VGLGIYLWRIRWLPTPKVLDQGLFTAPEPTIGSFVRLTRGRRIGGRESRFFQARRNISPVRHAAADAEPLARTPDACDSLCLIDHAAVPVAQVGEVLGSARPPLSAIGLVAMHVQHFGQQRRVIHI
jgi:hypothetical protein